MNPIQAQLNRLLRLEKYIEIALRDSIIELSDFIEELNRAQLNQGERSDGSILPNYSPQSVAMGKPSGPIRLFDQGDFYEGIGVNVFDDRFVLFDSDEKTGMLQQKYGSLILGLSDESIFELTQRLKPLMQIKMRMFLKSI